MGPSFPQRASLVVQTVTCLQERVAARQWQGWLPSERLLAEELQVSRSTLRRALAHLHATGEIQAEHGRGQRILGHSQRRPSLRSRDVAILVPRPLEQLRPSQALWIDALRAMLSERDCRLHLIHGHHYFRNHAEAALERLVRQRPVGCWILLLASAPCQRWFAQKGLPAIVAGSCHRGIDLPYRDLDHRAACRHAAGNLIALGHRRLAFVTLQAPPAGDIASELGFQEAIAATREEVTSSVAKHDGTPAHLFLTLRRLMAGRDRPTGLVVTQAYHALSVISGLARLGLRVPQDISVISRDDDPFFAFLQPEPCRYAADPKDYARRILPAIVESLSGQPVSRRAEWSMPRFLRGHSLAAP
jgi:LacI family transcriptional regulator